MTRTGARTGGTIFKDKDGKVTGRVAATRPAGSNIPSPSSAILPEDAGGAAGTGGTPDPSVPVATNPKIKTVRKGAKKGNGK